MPSNREEGFTIIEIIIALFILMVILFAFTTLFTGSISGIFGAGHKSSALYEAQREMDNEISEGLNDQYDPETHEIIFIDNDGEEIPVPVEGEEKQIEYEYEEYTDELYYFLPQGTNIFSR